MDIENEGGSLVEYILPCSIETLSDDDITIECNFNGLKAWINVYWVCLYSEEKLQSMERNLKVETLPSGVKIIDYGQFSYRNKYLIR